MNHTNAVPPLPKELVRARHLVAVPPCITVGTLTWLLPAPWYLLNLPIFLAAAAITLVSYFNARRIGAHRRIAPLAFVCLLACLLAIAWACIRMPLILDDMKTQDCLRTAHTHSSQDACRAARTSDTGRGN